MVLRAPRVPLHGPGRRAACIGCLIRATMHGEKNGSNLMNNKTAGYSSLLSSLVAPPRSVDEWSFSPHCACKLWLRVEQIRSFCC